MIVDQRVDVAVLAYRCVCVGGGGECAHTPQRGVANMLEGQMGVQRGVGTGQ